MSTNIDDTSSLVRKAAFVRSVAAEHAREAERNRTLHPAAVAAITEAGFPRQFVPRRWGGSGTGFADLLERASELAEGCPSAAWCATVLAAHGRLAAHLPEQGQRDLWGTSPDVLIAAAIAPEGAELTRAPGGWRLSGNWSVASAVDHADWVLLAAFEPREPGATAHGAAPSQRFLVVPRGDIRIHATWHSAGLRGTGSHSLTVQGAHVPACRTVGRDVVAAGLTDPGAERQQRLPYGLVASLMFAAPALGAARGALAAWLELMRDRRLPDGGPLLSDSALQQVFAQAGARIDAAQLLLERAAQQADQAPLAALPVARNVRDCAEAIDLLVRAVERLYRTAGARAQADACDLQRYWRDCHAVAAHAAVQLAPAAALYARSLPGAP
jgi:alkylation response protein AidB-like acyl-CoA dehydrogenase